MGRLYFDHNVSHDVGPFLWPLGHDFVFSRDEGSSTLTDDALLLLSVQTNRTFVTHNRRDFRLLHDAWMTWPAAFGMALPSHPGIIVLDQAPPAVLAQALADFLSAASLEQLADAILWWHRRDGWRQPDAETAWVPWRPSSEMASELRICRSRSTVACTPDVRPDHRRPRPPRGHQLLVEVERDDARPATRPSGVRQDDPRRPADVRAAGRDSELDLIIGGALILDPVLGIFKGEHRDQRGADRRIGRAGNPDIADDITVVSGANTGWIMAEGMIATPGIVDRHVHLATTSLIPAALSAGTTTIVGMGYGHVSDLGVNPAHNFHRLLEAWEAFPLNVQLLGRGSASDPSAIERNCEMGSAASRSTRTPPATPPSWTPP